MIKIKNLLVIVTFVISLVIWIFNKDVYQFIDDVIYNSPIEWQGYVINYSDELRVSWLDDSSLSIISKNDDFSVIYMRKHKGKIAPVESQIRSLCLSMLCESKEASSILISNKKMSSAKTELTLDGKGVIVEYIILDDDNILIEIKSIKNEYKKLREVVQKLKKI